jgi:hypothetical protein
MPGPPRPPHSAVPRGSPAASCQGSYGRRIGDRDTLVTEIAAWEHARNEQHASIRWQFTVDDARRKLHHLYPS